MTWLGPAADRPDAPALKVLDAILSGGKSSRLYDSLVYEQQIARGLLVRRPAAAAGMFAVGAIMAGGKTAVGEKALLRPGRACATPRPPPPNCPRPRTNWSPTPLRERETIDGRAFALGYALRTDGDAARANTDLADLQAVTAADVQRVAKKYLADDRPQVTIRYLPRAPGPRTSAARPRFHPSRCQLHRPRGDAGAGRPSARRRRRSPRPSRPSCRSRSRRPWPTACGSSSPSPATCPWSPPT
jgi:zinc protease